MKLFIPPLGKKLTLDEEWRFRMFPEARNELAAKTLGLKGKPIYRRQSPWGQIWGYYKSGTFDVETVIGDYQYASLPAGTEINLDRYYIKKGAKDYDSVTLYAKRPGDKKKMRFWVKLEDANEISVANEA